MAAGLVVTGPSKGGSAVQFLDRGDAGRRLAPLLAHLQGQDLVVVGLPNGGVPVAAEVALALGAPLDIIVVRKLGAPFQRELAVGAVGEGGVVVVDRRLAALTGLDDHLLELALGRQQAEVERRVTQLRDGLEPVALSGRCVVVVDDGVATGSTARAACTVARQAGAARVVLAVPVAPSASLVALGEVADEVVCFEAAQRFVAVGEFYRVFDQVGEAEVVAALHRLASRAG